MEFDGMSHAFGMVLQVFFLDLILSGDNALIIALACRSLPQDLKRRAIMLGTGIAIVLRVMLTLVISSLLDIPLLKIAGAIALLWIAIKLLLGDDDDDSVPDGNGVDQLWGAISMVVTADLVLSIDNVLALAAAAQGSVFYLILGLLLSVPLIMYGSLFVGRLLESYPVLVPAGSMVLAWLAGQMAVSDPLIADWISSQSPALPVVIPALCMVFVLVESRIIRQRRPLVGPAPAWQIGNGLTARLMRWGEARPRADTSVADSTAAVSQADSGCAAEDQPAITAAATVSNTMTSDALQVSGHNSVQPGHAAPEADKASATTAAVGSSEPVLEPGSTAPAGAPDDTAAETVTDSDSDVREESNKPSAMNLLLIALGVIAAVVFVWFIVHLVSQGGLPPPQHPQRPH